MPTLHARTVARLRAKGRVVREAAVPRSDLVALWLLGTRARLAEDLRSSLAMTRPAPVPEFAVTFNRPEGRWKTRIASVAPWVDPDLTSLAHYRGAPEPAAAGRALGTVLFSISISEVDYEIDRAGRNSQISKATDRQ